MKNFIEALEKYGYEAEGKSIGTDGQWWIVEFGGKYVTIHDHDREQPELLVACLDEIERLGREWLLSVVSNAKGIVGYRLSTATTTGRQVLEVRGKTKTEACCNALLAALDAKENTVWESTTAT